jgi:hypothetical protein
MAPCSSHVFSSGKGGWALRQMPYGRHMGNSLVMMMMLIMPITSLRSCIAIFGKLSETSYSKLVVIKYDDSNITGIEISWNRALACGRAVDDSPASTWCWAHLRASSPQRLMCVFRAGAPRVMLKLTSSATAHICRKGGGSRQLKLQLSKMSCWPWARQWITYPC